MAIEVEQKFRVFDAAALEEQLRHLGAQRGEVSVQVDCYYSHPSRDFAKTDEALRLRRVGPLNYLTYKGAKLDATTKTRQEIEISLTPGQPTAGDIAQLLGALGFKRVATVRKRRVHFTLPWQDQQVEVALDDVQGLGDFIELEVVTQLEDMPAARAKIASLAAQLQLTAGERRSYLEMLLAIGAGTAKP